MTGAARVRQAGDAAILLTLEGGIDPHVNARAISIAHQVRQRSHRGVRDVLSTFRSVAVYFDPLAADVDEISAHLAGAAQIPAAPGAGRRHEVDVAYGGDDGPDLDEVAAHAGVTRSQVVDRHANVPYRVFMLGFQPGFAYMGLVDPTLAIPRRPTPRLRVPAGSVGIAGRQTGIYPFDGPGGWRLVGRALEPVFDAQQQPPARFAPGDTVVFKPAARRRVMAGGFTVAPPLPSGRRVTVLRPGLFTTVQDGGHWGEQGIGVPVSGAMDAVSHAVANAAVGNDLDAPSLEVTIAGPELRVEQETIVAVAGAHLSAALDGVPMPLDTPVHARPGSVLRFGRRVQGARAYVAFDGGIARQSPSWPVAPLGSGHVLGLAASAGSRVRRGRALPLPSGGARLRVVPGPQGDELPPGCLAALCGRRFVISPQSNRMGYRLIGAAVPAAAGGMISDATFAGGIQIPPSGEPILLMSDRQTTGGYPQVATVITADLCVAGQLAPGDWIEFARCSRAAAVTALAQRLAWGDAR